MNDRYLFSRRHLLCCGAAAVAGLFTSLQADAALPGIDNPCRGRLPEALARHELVRAAFEGLDAAALWDVHAHLLGTGDSGSGCTVHPSMSQWWRPIEVLRRHAILNAACVDGDTVSVDRAYVERLLTLTGDFPAGARWLLFAFDNARGDDGALQPDHTTFHVPDHYAREVCARHAARLGFVASIHPYAPDAIERLDRALAAGALAIKWLPSAMNIDPRDRRCRPFYDRLAAARVPLIAHFGEEYAVPGAGRNDLGNPLLARTMLEAGVRVVMAHCASLGQALDGDKPSAPRIAAFDLFARLMDERAHEKLLLGDTSAVQQINRDTDVVRRLIVRDDWHGRLLHGSDYPLPGIPILTRVPRLADAGLLDAEAVPVLEQIREHNPLLFDFVLKRSLRVGARALPPAVFETRRHFARA
jgi:mannonate dehydratase